MSSFAIEVPGEAAPLSQWELAKALSRAATSTDHAQRQSAGQQLQAWESHSDYFTLLQVCAVHPSCTTLAVCNNGKTLR